MLILLKSTKMGFISHIEEKPTPASRGKILTFASSGITCITLAVVLLFVDLIDEIAKYKTRIGLNTPVHDILKSTIEGIHISAYLFNYTNAEEFMSGLHEKLKLEEIGPFTYRELRRQDNLELDEAAGVVRYSPRITPVFMPEKSIADPKDVQVTLPSISMMTMASKMSQYPFISRVGFNLLVDQLDAKPMVTMDAHNYLWGYYDRLTSLGHTFMPTWIHFNTIGLMDRMYDKDLEYTLEVGATDEDRFMIKKLNGHSGLLHWDFDDPDKRTKCNSLTNVYEGFAYPTDLTRDTPVRIFRNVLCRMLELDYQETVALDYGPKALLYKISNRTFLNGPDKDCTCGKEKCIDGLSDVSPCFYELPLSMSNAHFLYGGPHLTERIEGMKPDEKKHGSVFYIEPKIGAALGAKFSIQVNIVVGDVSYNEQAKMFSNMILPIGYFTTEQVPVPESTKTDFYNMYVTGPYLVLTVQVILFVLGTLLVFYAGRLLYWNWLCNGDRVMEFQSPEEGKKLTIGDVSLWEKNNV